jgi:hypothetical protein
MIEMQRIDATGDEVLRVRLQERSPALRHQLRAREWTAPILSAPRTCAATS